MQNIINGVDQATAVWGLQGGKAQRRATSVDAITNELVDGVINILDNTSVGISSPLVSYGNNQFSVSSQYSPEELVGAASQAISNNSDYLAGKALTFGAPGIIWGGLSGVFFTSVTGVYGSVSSSVENGVTTVEGVLSDFLGVDVTLYIEGTCRK